MSVYVDDMKAQFDARTRQMAHCSSANPENYTFGGSGMKALRVFLSGGGVAVQHDPEDPDGECGGFSSEIASEPCEVEAGTPCDLCDLPIGVEDPEQ